MAAHLLRIRAQNSTHLSIDQTTTQVQATEAIPSTLETQYEQIHQLFHQVHIYHPVLYPLLQLKFQQEVVYIHE